MSLKGPLWLRANWFTNEKKFFYRDFTVVIYCQINFTRNQFAMHTYFSFPPSSTLIERWNEGIGKRHEYLEFMKIFPKECSI